MRLIDADAMMFQLANKHAHSWGKVERAFGEAVEMLNNAPTIDAEPVRHGRWENYPGHIYRRCSICKVEWEKTRFNIRANYCPNCGAKMDGGAEDN